LFSDPPKDAADAGSKSVDRTEFQKYFVRHGRYTAGTQTRYRPSIISAKPTYQALAKGLVIGMRFHSASVIRLADAKAVHLGHAIKADGRWRVFVFCRAEDPSAASSSVRSLCDFLAQSQDSPVRKYTPSGTDIDSVIDVRAVFQQDHRELAIEAMPSFLLPRKGRYGLRDYEKMFCPVLKSGNDIFDIREIDRDGGCMVVVRPDQYIANVLPLDAYTELASFFEGFMTGKD
jgi:phenol 2-monooxygenase